MRSAHQTCDMRNAQPSEARTVVARNIRAELARRGMPVRHLTEALGVTYTGVTRRLSGQTPLDVDEVAAVARFLGIPVIDLFAGIDALAVA